MPDQRPSQQQRGERFKALHEGDPFVIPNPWDAGTARVMAALGFEALATTSAGFAFTLGRLDSGVSLEELSDHVELLAAATELPLAVDIEDGFGPEPGDAAEAVRRVGGAGAVGGSIEDWDPREGEIYPLERAAERIAAAAEAAESLDFPFTLTGRAENHLRGHHDLDDTIARLQAYERAGAQVLYAPALRDHDQVAAVCQAVSAPVNVLAHPGLSMEGVVEAGAQRVSVGSGLTWVAVGAMASAAERIRESGSFEPLAAEVKIGEWLG
jgi:2-methylisocitrate lyase-like PEP mutase family enzyme